MSKRLSRFASWRLDRAARRMARPGRCNAISPTLTVVPTGVLRVPCVLKPGHTGQHRGSSGTAWWMDR